MSSSFVYNLKKKYKSLNLKKLEKINSNVFKIENKLFKVESERFVELFSTIEKIYNFYGRKFIPKYELILEPNIFSYDYIKGTQLFRYEPLTNNWFNNIFYKNKIERQNIIIKNLTNFIKKTFEISPKDFKEIPLDKNNIYPEIEYFNIIENNFIDIFSKKDKKIYLEVKKIFNKYKNKKYNLNNKLIYFSDCYSHNIILGNDNSITQIDLTAGFQFVDFNKYSHKYISMLWAFNEEAVNYCINKCNLNYKNNFIKEKSFVYYITHQLVQHYKRYQYNKNDTDYIKNKFYKISTKMAF